MAKVKISDVIVPEVFAPYVSNRTKELSVLIGSGIAVSNKALDELVTKGGKLINMPFWKDLTGEDEVLSEDDPLTPMKTSAGKDVAAMVIRGNAWSANELAGALAGSDPMADIASKVAAYRARREQAMLLSVLKGALSAPSMANHVNDQSEHSIVGNMVLDTKQLLGDAADQLTAIAVHSAVYTQMQKQDMIQFVQPSDGGKPIAHYMTYRVLVDDGCPVDAGVYSTYLFGPGVIGRGDGTPETLTPVEVDRDSLASDDFLIHRWAMVLHPFGVKFKNVTVTGATPSNAELALPANWERVVEDKQIGIAVLKHKI